MKYSLGKSFDPTDEGIRLSYHSSGQALKRLIGGVCVGAGLGDGVAVGEVTGGRGNDGCSSIGGVGVRVVERLFKAKYPATPAKTTTKTMSSIFTNPFWFI
jgi:hypothetical protein